MAFGHCKNKSARWRTARFVEVSADAYAGSASDRPLRPVVAYHFAADHGDRISSIVVAAGATLLMRHDMCLNHLWHLGGTMLCA
jgi:hypothetical protein